MGKRRMSNSEPPDFKFTGHATRQRVREDIQHLIDKREWGRGHLHWGAKLREHLGRPVDQFDEYILALEYVAGFRE